MGFDNFEITATGPLTIRDAHTGEVLWIGAGRIEQPTASSVAIDEYDALMRRLYLRLHRKLWNWIADETERTHKCVDKWDAFKHFGWNVSIDSQCWACRYMRWRRKYDPFVENCYDHCLLDWGVNERTGKKVACIDNDIYNQTIYEIWRHYAYRYDWERAAKAARIIANLPERE